MYTLSDMVTKTGMKPRALQLWAEAGVIQADNVHGGAGAHRRYSDYELFVASCIVPLARMQVSIGTLRKAADCIRALPHRDVPSAIRLAVTHDGSVIASWFDGSTVQWTVDIARLSAYGAIVHIMPTVLEPVVRRVAA